MAVGIVKYFYDRASQPIGVSWFTVSLFAVSLSLSVVMDPIFGSQNACSKLLPSIFIDVS